MTPERKQGEISDKNALSLYFGEQIRLYCFRSRLIRRLLLRARDPEALALKFFYPVALLHTASELLPSNINNQLLLQRARLYFGASRKPPRISYPDTLSSARHSGLGATPASPLISLIAWSLRDKLLLACLFKPPIWSFSIRGKIVKRLYFPSRSRLYCFRSRLIRRLLLRARDPEALALKFLYRLATKPRFASLASILFFSIRYMFLKAGGATLAGKND